MAINLTTFVPDNGALNLHVMELFGRKWLNKGNAGKYFGDELFLIQVGGAQTEDQERGAYEWYPLTIEGNCIGELRDTANGLHIYAIEA